jgi:hypothetical protein
MVCKMAEVVSGGVQLVLTGAKDDTYEFSGREIVHPLDPLLLDYHTDSSHRNLLSVSAEVSRFGKRQYYVNLSRAGE